MLRVQQQPQSLTTLSRGVSGQLTATGSALRPVLQFARGKRTKRVATVSTGTQRIISQLSVISQRKKAPRMLKLSNEDLIRHNTVQTAWAVYQKDKRVALNSQLEKQYNSIVGAMEDLQKVNPELYEFANREEKGKRWSLDARVPVHYPGNKIWNYNVDKEKK